MLTTLSGNLILYFSFSPIEIARIKHREILSPENREIKYDIKISVVPYFCCLWNNCFIIIIKYALWLLLKDLEEKLPQIFSSYHYLKLEDKIGYFYSFYVYVQKVQVGALSSKRVNIQFLEKTCTKVFNLPF